MLTVIWSFLVDQLYGFGFALASFDVNVQNVALGGLNKMVLNTIRESVQL